MTDWDGCRWDGRSAHYESWFQRANHPTRPLAFWIRHTLFCPGANPEASEGEIWSVWFDGEKRRTVAAKTEIPRRDCAFEPNRLEVNMPGAQLKPGVLQGGTGALKWNLTWSGGGPVSLLLPEPLYAGRFPKAKVLCVSPNVCFDGTYVVDGESYAIDSWPGSHNHNWGSQHTDRYTWAQVCGFDGAPDVFLECATAQIKVGPVMTPRMTIAVLSVEGRRYEFNSISRALRAKTDARGFLWRFLTSADGAEIEVGVEALREHFVGLRYRNPPAGAKACLNSKIASCRLVLRAHGKTRTFKSVHRAAFEILCEENDPRVKSMGGLSA